MAMTRFKDLDDMKYYDEKCEAHKKLKEQNAPIVDMPPLTFYMEDKQ